jgi:hypothetical protein
MKKINTILRIAAITVIQGCSVINFGSQVASTPFFSSENGIPESQILFQDDFSQKGSGWTTLVSPQGSSVAYAHQGLEFINYEAEKDFWSTREGDYSNVAVGVDGSKLGGPDDNTFGVICRFVDSGNFYAFLIGSDGYYGIIKVKDGVYSLISGSSMDYSESIIRGRGTNRILGVCSEDLLGLFVNGDLLSIVQDTDLTRGRIGLISGTNEEPGTDILFDNLILYQQ